jgi:nicotinate-nucleotide pyrophosphorylase (carboxylating)
VIPLTAKIEVEVETLISLEEMRKAVKIVNGRAQVEAPGGITLDQLAEVAATG